MVRKIVLLLTVSGTLLFGQTYIIPDLQRDDFTGSALKSWWSNVKAPSSSTNHTLQVLNGYLEAVLKDPLNGGPGGRLQADYNGMENIGIATAYNTNLYSKHLQMTAVMRVKTLNDLNPGTRGWGFWRSEGLPVTINQATWFFEQMAVPDSSWAAAETYWRAQTLKGISPDYRKESDLTASNQIWHVYKVKRYSGTSSEAYYEHYIDGVLVQRIVPTDFPDGNILNEDYSFHAWNDNLVYHHTTTASGQDTIEVFYNGWLGASAFVIDFIEITKNGYDPGYMVTPVDASDFLRLRAYESEMDQGISDGLWKSYSFETQVGNTFVIVTAKAENYDAYDGDDNLKIVVDAADYGYDTVNSWNGDVDDGLPKTLVFTPALSAGSHTLEVHSQNTPVLYDVNVLNALEGALVLDQTLNETAPAGSQNYLWKEFTFNCDAGPIAIYVSASADEEPGWDYINANIDSSDDDELRIELDNTDFGWGGDYGFEGNGLFGDVKTLLIKDTVAGGTHTLKLYANETPTVYRVLVFAENGDYSLPVALSSFEAARTNAGVLLRWTTESEVDNHGFNIYRAESADSLLPGEEAFVKINETIIPGQGSRSDQHTYEYNDNTPSGDAYLWYRLESVGFDGKTTVHKTVALAPRETPALQAFRLWQNFPNPFNPMTAIRFAIPQETFVTVEIFNVHGQKIRTLWDGRLTDGEHRFYWDGRNDQSEQQSSGVYIYRIKTPRRMQSGKMTLLR
ncbi:FlgD immunoglobulin-like domain containing protein [Calditrichota bacterium GD2]